MPRCSIYHQRHQQTTTTMMMMYMLLFLPAHDCYCNKQKLSRRITQNNWSNVNDTHKNVIQRFMIINKIVYVLRKYDHPKNSAWHADKKTYSAPPISHHLHKNSLLQDKPSQMMHPLN